ncbi:MAG TPA: polysaccharide deacetylase family protein [Solirubrobacterales bacterium]|nr:polysaccharide deacetylase family protein [Solirubrobacterales bacterium]
MRYPLTETFWQRIKDSDLVAFAKNYDVFVYKPGTKEEELPLWSAEEGGVAVEQPLATDDGGRARGEDAVLAWVTTPFYDIEVNGVRIPVRLGGAGEGGGGGVESVNGDSGPAVVLDAADVGAATAADVDAEEAARIAADAAHTADTTAVHGIADTSALALKSEVATDAELAAHDADTTAVHGIADTSKLATKAEVEPKQDAATAATDAELNAHINDTSDAHDASAISYAGGTGMSATDVEAAIDELATEKANASDVATDAELAAAAGRLVREELPLAMFPDEHGWTGNGTGAFSDAGGELILNTDRSFKIETNGTGGTSIATSPALTAIDLRDKHVVFHSQLSFATRLKTVKLRLASGNIATDYAEVTIWNEESDSVPLQSTWERQSFPIKAFAVTGAVDWSAIDSAQILVTDKNTGKFTLYVAGIYAVPTRPKAVISFCFDDNYASVFSTALHKLSAHRYPASAYAIVDTVGSAERLTLAQLKILRDQHGWEVAGHAYTVTNHNLSSGLDSIAAAADLEAELNGLRDWLDENGFRRATFAYPKGSAKMEKARPSVIKDYGAGRSTAQGPETIPPRDDYTLRGWSVDGTVDTAATIKAAIDKAIEQGSWLILTFHDIVAGSPTKATEFKSSDFSSVVDYIRAKQVEGKEVEVRTVADAMSATPPGTSVGARVWYETKIFTIPDEIKVASGDIDYIVPFVIALRTGQTAKVVKAFHRLNSGTNAKVKLQKNGADLTGFTAIEVKAEQKTTDPADQAIVDGDRLALVVESVSGSPKNLTFAVVIEHSEL